MEHLRGRSYRSNIGILQGFWKLSRCLFIVMTFVTFDFRSVLLNLIYSLES